jgi:hypothetical protein
MIARHIVNWFGRNDLLDRFGLYLKMLASNMTSEVWEE